MWHNEKPWTKNNRIIETYITSGSKDLHGDIVNIEKVKEVMPWLIENGFYEWQHTGFPIGKFLGWRDEGDKIKVRIGIFDSVDSKFKEHDHIWDVIKGWKNTHGTYGQSSIKGIANKQKLTGVGKDRANYLEEIPMWAVGWVGDDAANKDAVVTYINESAKCIVKSLTPEEITALGKTLTSEQTAPELLSRVAKSLVTLAEVTEKLVHSSTKRQKDNEKIVKEEKSMTEAIQKAEEAPIEEPVAVEEPVVEEPAPPIEETPAVDLGAQVERLEAAVGRIAGALTTIEDGTPEVADEIANAGEDALAILDSAEEGVNEEVMKRIGQLEKSVMEIADRVEAIQKKLTAPKAKSKTVAVQPVQKGTQPLTKEEVLAEFRKHY